MTDNAQEANRMLLEVYQLLPAEPSGAARMIAAVLGVAGLGLWVAGTRVSRPLITLVTVLAGAGIGSLLPRWFKWDVSAAGPAVGGAVVLGVSGFVLHRTWVAFAFGAVLALWTALALWVHMHDGGSWAWPSIDESTSALAYAKALWGNVPADFAKYAPFACGVALVAGVAMTILWSRLATVVCWSMVGTTLMLMFGVWSMLMARPQWAAKVPQRTIAQVGIVMGMVAVGALVQWRLMPRPPAKPQPEKSKPNLD